MTSKPTIQNVDRADPRVIAAAYAERRLFDHYGLDPQVHDIELQDPEIRVRTLEVGSGPPLLLVPGGPGEAFHFAPLMAQLQGWRLITFDRPGGAMSDAVDHREVDLRQFAVSILTAVLDYFELDQVPVLASSMGGLWSLWLALDRPERVSSMVQFSCPALVLGTSAPAPMRVMSVPYINRLAFRLFLADSPEKAASVLGMLGCSEGTVDALPDQYLETMFRMFNLPTHRLSWLSLMETVLRPRGANPEFQLGPADLGRIEQRVQFIWGSGDVFGSVEVGSRLASIIPDAALEVVEGSHVPFVDNPDECARLAVDFLQQCDAPNAPVRLTPASLSS